MRVVAPGKVLISGAYAVLRGAPAIVAAVNRHAIAEDGSPTGEVPAEVARALAGRATPRIDTSSLYARGTKLGLGSSAAAAVAALGWAERKCASDLTSKSVRQSIFDRARAAHEAVQNGGSGVDVAASAFGGVLVYRLTPEGPSIRHVELPTAIVVRVYWSGTSARTSTLRAAVDRLKERDARRHDEHMAALSLNAEAAVAAVDACSAVQFLASLRAASVTLDALGSAADAPIVPAAFKHLGAVASESGSVFYPSGAGGGDIGLYVGQSNPSVRFEEEAMTSRMTPLHVEFDHAGVRVFQNEVEDQ